MKFNFSYCDLSLNVHRWITNDFIIDKLKSEDLKKKQFLLQKYYKFNLHAKLNLTSKVIKYKHAISFNDIDYSSYK